MKIRYSYTWKEFRQYSTWQRRQITHRQLACAYGAMALIVILYTATLIWDSHREPFFVPLVLQIDAKTLLWLLPIGIVLSWLFGAVGQKVEIDSEGAVYSRSFEPLRLPWQSITVLDEDDHAIYMAFYHRPFFLSPRAPTSLMIPKRAFADAGEVKRFYELAQEYCREAGGHPVASVSTRPSLPQAS